MTHGEDFSMSKDWRPIKNSNITWKKRRSLWKLRGSGSRCRARWMVWAWAVATLEVGSCISLSAMGLVHSYLGFSKSIYKDETIMQLWLLLILSFDFFPSGWKLLWCHDTCSSPWWPEAQPLDGGGVCRSPKISKKIPWSSFEQWKLVAKFIYIECGVVRKLWFWYIFMGKITRHQEKFQSLVLSWNNENFLNSMGGFVVVNWLRPRPHGDTNVVA